MAALKIQGGVRIRGGTACDDAALEVGVDEWPELLRRRREFCEKIVPRDCRMLLFFVKDAEQAGWLGYEDRESYLRDGLNLDPELVQWALRGLEKTRPDEAVALADAVVLGQREIGVEGGKAGPGRGKKTVGNTKRFVGNTRPQIIARLRRDRPDLAQRVDAKELSANAAAIEAGIRRRTFTVPDDLEGAIAAIQKRFNVKIVAVPKRNAA